MKAVKSPLSVINRGTLAVSRALSEVSVINRSTLGTLAASRALFEAMVTIQIKTRTKAISSALSPRIKSQIVMS